MSLIFCVEDDLGIRELISCALSSGGYDSKGFGNGTSFFEELNRNVPDLILMDVMLPGADGITLLKRLKSSSVYSDIPVIMLTACSSEINKVTGLEAGADDYISKPFGIMELLSRIKAVLRRVKNSPGAGSSLITIDNLAINLQKRTVHYGENEIELTYKEFELLSFLARNCGNAVSREELLCKVWGAQFEGETRTVDVHVKTLRQKLESGGCCDIIKTVRGFGYKLL